MYFSKDQWYSNDKANVIMPLYVLVLYHILILHYPIIHKSPIRTYARTYMYAQVPRPTFYFIGVAPVESRQLRQCTLRLPQHRQHPGRHSLHVPASPLQGRLLRELRRSRGSPSSDIFKGVAWLKEDLPAV